MIAPDTDSPEQIIKTNIDNMVKTEITKVYLAKDENEANQAFDDLLMKADKMGIEKLETWANAQYGPFKEKYDSLTKK
ncbi:hypothetical protein D3C77_660630 [compost metagenome]